MTEVKEGVVQIIAAPQRGRQAEPIPDDLIRQVLDNLGKVDKNQVISTGKLFQKSHQAQAYRNRLIEALESADKEYAGKLGASVLPVEEDKDGKPSKYVLAIRKQG